MTLPFLSQHKPAMVRRPQQPMRDDGRGTATSRFAKAIGASVEQADGSMAGPDADFALPHVLQFSGIIGGAWRTYYHGQYDEAMHFSQEDALAMRNDAWLMSLLNERKRAVATLGWHLEGDNPRDPVERALAAGLTQLYKNIPRETDLTWSGLEAIWFGRAGDQFKWRYKNIKVPAMPRLAAAPGVPATMVSSDGEFETRRCLWMDDHMPVEGDKIDYDFDGNPYVLVSPIVALNTYQQYKSVGAEFRKLVDGSWRNDQEPPRPMTPDLKAAHASLGFTTIGGKALFLKGNWRSRFRIHTHEAIDSSYWQPWKAGSLHGVGIRSVVFWYWWLRQEYLANVTDWCARTGLGIKLWYYEQGNNASKSAILQAAKDQSNKVNIAVPYDPSQPNRPAVDIVEMAGTGADMLITIVKHVEEYIERYVVGQNMTGGSDDFSQGFGDKGRAELANRTSWQITKLDARKFADTNTTDIFDVIKRFSYPEYAEIPMRQVYEVDDPDIGKWIEGAKTFVEMGGEIVEDEARSKLGLTRPQASDRTIGGAAALQAQQATSGHVAPPDGMGKDQSNGKPPETNGSPEKNRANLQDKPKQEPDPPARYAHKPDESHAEQPPINVTVNVPAQPPANVTVHNETPERTIDVPERVEQRPVETPAVSFTPEVLQDVVEQADAYGENRIAFMHSCIRALKDSDSQLTAIVVGRRRFLEQRQQYAKEAVDRVVAEMRAEAVEKERVAQEERERLAREQRERERYEEASKKADKEAEMSKSTAAKDKMEAELLKAIADKLEGLRAQPMDMDALAAALRSMPAPVVSVEPVDVNALAKALVQAMPKAAERPTSVTIVKDKNGKFTATPKFD